VFRALTPVTVLAMEALETRSENIFKAVARSLSCPRLPDDLASVHLRRTAVLALRLSRDLPRPPSGPLGLTLDLAAGVVSRFREAATRFL
jgi:hypothetical protein